MDALVDGEELLDCVLKRIFWFIFSLMSTDSICGVLLMITIENNVWVPQVCIHERGMLVTIVIVITSTNPKVLPLY